MQRCFELAQNGLGYAAPNPIVGAVIVREDRIVGEGYHQAFGEAHAEVKAIQNALKIDPGMNFNNCTLYVSLEPCSHHGKTPPCTDLIIKSQFKRVLIGCKDPFEKVSGSGIRKLESSGIEVQKDFLEAEAIHLNRRFFCFHKKQRPYIILKYAKSKDGFISAEAPDEENRWITNKYSRILVHKWRSQEQAILVGAGTARIDNPALTLRDWPGKQPLRIVIDKDLSLPKDSKLFDQSAATLVFNGLKDEIKKNLERKQVNLTASLLPQICKELYSRSIQSVIVEGGQKLLQSFINENLWDEARVLTGNKLLKKGVSSPIHKGELISTNKIDDDVLEIFKPHDISHSSVIKK
jgi:diaminohydroxyphosphoribosylaminopyrimidine deaminase/5-amino-6-(5-phosphoribosylamino)uracil reductase